MTEINTDVARELERLRQENAELRETIQNVTRWVSANVDLLSYYPRPSGVFENRYLLDFIEGGKAWGQIGAAIARTEGKS